MASSPTLSKVFLSLVLLFFVSLSSSFATSPLTLDSAYSPQSQAEKLIRNLNLFPKEPVNIIKVDLNSFVPGKIVEKKFSFLGHSGPSFEDLGHHADQPTGTGFSYSSDDGDIRHDEVGVSNDLYDFLQEFFKVHPEFVKNDFYITGESYAGHYIPALASRVNQGNKQNQGIHINLKGFAIGNGLTNPAIQYRAYPDFALDNKLITKANYNEMSKLIPDCERAAKTCETQGGQSCTTAYNTCQNIFSLILFFADNINYYDIRKQCEGSLCYDFQNVEKLLNQQKVKSAIGVRDDLVFVSCSLTVHEAMMQDLMRNLEVGIPALLEDGIKMLLYVGEEDLVCNWLGNSRWVHAMEWSGQKAFGASPTVKFLVDGVEAGSLNSYGPLSFLKVHGAGHLVPMDQPKAALQMLQRWMGGKLT